MSMEKIPTHDRHRLEDMMYDANYAFGEARENYKKGLL